MSSWTKLHSKITSTTTINNCKSLPHLNTIKIFYNFKSKQTSLFGSSSKPGVLQQQQSTSSGLINNQVNSPSNSSFQGIQIKRRRDDDDENYDI